MKGIPRSTLKLVNKLSMDPKRFKKEARGVHKYSRAEVVPLDSKQGLVGYQGVRDISKVRFQPGGPLQRIVSATLPRAP